MSKRPYIFFLGLVVGCLCVRSLFVSIFLDNSRQKNISLVALPSEKNSIARPSKNMLLGEKRQTATYYKERNTVADETSTVIDVHERKMLFLAKNITRSSPFKTKWLCLIILNHAYLQLFENWLCGLQHFRCTQVSAFRMHVLFVCKI
jgi:hypothetical protein